MSHIPPDSQWYLGEIILECQVEADPQNVVHFNLHLIKADSPDQAYDKAIALGHASEAEYTNSEGGRVRWIFRGLSHLDVVYDPLEDGVELSYEAEVDVPPERLAERVTPREELSLFRASRFEPEGVNYGPGDVYDQLLDGLRKAETRLGGESAGNGRVGEETAAG